MADNITSLNTGLASFTAQSLEQKRLMITMIWPQLPSSLKLCLFINS